MRNKLIYAIGKTKDEKGKFVYELIHLCITKQKPVNPLDESGNEEFTVLSNCIWYFYREVKNKFSCYGVGIRYTPSKCCVQYVEEKKAQRIHCALLRYEYYQSIIMSERRNRKDKPGLLAHSL